ncbi:MAG TPA: undecaprenyl-diphosphate phosphatase [Gemmataceae bacterium]|nr:undecaprenyl-diphosphate phosphatase [Gemmataceae bacterium]
MNYPQIILLALIQGMAELLPVSSTAHVIVAERLMGLDPSAPELTFLLVMLHTGTMFAVLFYFWPRWKPLLFPAVAGETKDATPRSKFQFITMILLATVVTGVLGLGLKFLIEKVILIGMLHHEKGEVEHLFKNMPLIATGLFLVGLLILAAGSRERKSETWTIRPRSSIWIGLVQGLCLPFRGFSRSGATISTALFCGIARPLAEDFSFALAVVLTPPVIVLELYRLLRAKEWQTTAGLMELLLPGAVGMVCSFFAGLLALKLLSAALEKGRWKYFGIYCVAASIAVLVAVQFGL